MDVQIFGVRKDADTRKALRFFKERRVKVHFVDFKVRPPARGEVRRFVLRFGVDALVDRAAARFRALGLQHAHYGPERWMDLLTEEPLILRMPLVRWGAELTVGLAEEIWKTWVRK